jgi:uncharacterized protein YcfJ
MISGQFIKKTVTAFTIVAFLGACQTTQNAASNANLTPEEKRLREQADDFNTTIVEGAVFGAIAGAVLGALLSSGSNRAKGAAAGAVAGAALGGASGYYVAKSKENFATEQAKLDSMITDVKADNSRLQAYIANTNSVVSKNQQELNAMQTAVKNGTKKRDDMTALLARVEGNRGAIKVALDKLKVNKTEYINASNQMKSDPKSTVSVEPLNYQIAELEGKIQVLERQYADISRLITVNQLS